MTPEQIAKFIAGDIAKTVNKVLGEIKAGLEKRIAESETAFQNQLASMHPEKGDKGDPGEVDMKAVAALIAEEVKKIEIPAPEKGDKGEQGEKGEPGEPGIVDMSQVAKMIEEQISKIEIPAPEKGEQGEKGEPGQVDMEQVASLIAQEVAKIEIPAPEKGEKGDRGEPGTVDDAKLWDMIVEQFKKVEIPVPEKGEKGDPGHVDMEAVKKMIQDEVKAIPIPEPRSPLDIEIEPSIDEKKSYPRGVYAKHRGGLWRSFQKTKGMRGWECIISGIAEIGVDYDGERTVTIVLSKSEDEQETKTVKIPVPLEKGVYRDSETYEKADIVTFSGAMWIALKDNPAGRPGISSDWRLSVKRGGTGKSAYDLAREAGFKGTRQEWLDSLGKKPIVKVET